VAARKKKRIRNHTWVLGLCPMLLIVSCGKSNHPPTFPVEGQVFVERRPAYKAIVWFHSVEPVEPGSPRPHAVVDKDGSFAMGTYAANDGVPAGKYRVAVYWRVPPKSGDEDGESLIPSHYMDPAKSGLPEVEVADEAVTLPPFRLTFK